MSPRRPLPPSLDGVFLGEVFQLLDSRPTLILLAYLDLWRRSRGAGYC
ncbi:hypothetical protein [uncultured Thiodictyon sp.]|nr:hypothetical protein [uncultured Thiodictyon sp.]